MAYRTKSQCQNLHCHHRITHHPDRNSPDPLMAANSSGGHKVCVRVRLMVAYVCVRVREFRTQLIPIIIVAAAMTDRRNAD